MGIDFHFERLRSPTDTGVYIVTFFLVLISWFPLWLSCTDHAVARLGLGLGCVGIMGLYSLIVVTWYGKEGAAAHAMTAWLPGCWLCSLLPLVEMGLVFVLYILVPAYLARFQVKHTPTAIFVALTILLT